jgi:hypothetical protein
VSHARRVRRVLCVLVSRVSGDLGGDVVSDPLRHSIAVGEELAEPLIERLEDIAQAVGVPDPACPRSRRATVFLR